MNRQIARTLHAQLQTALDAGKFPPGFKVTIGRGTFDPEAGECSYKVEFRATDAPGKDAVRFDNLRKFVPGLPERGATIPYAGRQWVIVGANNPGTKIKVKPAGGGDKVYLIPLAHITTRPIDKAHADPNSLEARAAAFAVQR